MAVIDLSITSQRKQVVDFTMPYMNTGSKQHYILLQSYLYNKGDCVCVCVCSL